MAVTLESHYARIEEETAAFSRATGIACPPGCGVCCTRIDFHVSGPEAELVAEYLLDRPALLARFEARFEARFAAQPDAEGKTECPLYDPDDLDAHCTVYPARPLLCRTFAFAAHREKSGTPVYAPCHRFREDPMLAPKVEAARRGGHPKLPILPDDSLAVWALDPAGDALPMAAAIRRALDRLRLRRSFEKAREQG